MMKTNILHRNKFKILVALFIFSAIFPVGLFFGKIGGLVQLAIWCGIIAMFMIQSSKDK